MDEPIAEKQDAEKPHGPALLLPTLKAAWSAAVNVLTPPLCLACRAPVAQGAALCLSCWQQLSFLEEPVCDALGTPFAFDEGEGALSPAAIADPPPWQRGRAAVAYSEVAQRLVQLLKYEDTHEAGHAMARMMAGAGRRLLAEADVIIPVPLNRWRLWRRRYNQAAVLAHGVGRHSAVPVATDVLLRIRPTPQQVGLTAAERRRNVRKAFDVPPDRRSAVDGKAVLLVDDVRTTGATAEACTDALLAAGAARVDVLTFALVLQPARLHI